MPVQDELLLRLITQEENEKALDEARERLDKMTDSEKKLFKASQDSAKADKQRVKGLADLKAGFDMVANVAGKVFDFFKESVDQTVEYAAQVRDLSRAIGASAEESSMLIQAADDVGVEVGTLEAAFKAAIKNGIQPSIINLAMLSDEYNSIQDPVQRSQFAMDKFGRAGLDMAKMLEQGGDAIRDAGKAAKDLGLTLDDAAVKSARELEIQIDNLNDRMDALKLNIGKSVIPGVVSFATALDHTIASINGQVTPLEEANYQYEQAVKYFGETSQEAINLKMQLDILTAAWKAVGMTEQEHNLRQEMTKVKTLEVQYATKEQVAGMQALALANQQGGASQDAYNKVADQTKATMDAAAAAQATYRSGVSETIGKIDNLAMSLAKATDAQAKQMLAQSALDAIRQAQEKGVISAGDAAKATDAVLIKYGLATEKSLAMAKAQEQVNTALIAGDLGWRTYVEDIDKIPQAADDGTISMSDLNKLGIRPTTTATMEQTGKVNLLADAWMHIPREVQTQYTITQTGTIPGRAYGGPVSAGLPYLVGERGPEMFVPRQSGDIISNQMTNNYNITTDRTGLAFIFERQRQAQSRM